MSAARALCVHNLAQLVAALDACRAAGCTPVLLSAPAAGCHGGGLWWQALIARGCAAAGIAPASCTAWLDCGAAPGWAMAALRAGCRHLVLAPCPGRQAVLGAATTLGARLRADRLAALDLAHPATLRALHATLAAAGLPRDPTRDG